jgi:hypothetical protein
MKRLALLLLLLSCMKTEVLNAPEEEEVVVEKRKKPEKPLHDKPEQTDTTRVSITFEPSVEDWNETETEINT